MKHILLILLFAVPALPVAAQEEEGEVIVIAELNRAEVRQYIEEAEDQFYSIFNANVDDDDYKISCSMETPTGSNIRVRVCEPEFMIRARAENARLLDINSGGFAPDQAVRRSVETEYANLQQKMEQMTQELPEFAQIASILTQLRARLAQLTE